MFDKTRNAIRKANNAADKVANGINKVNRALTTSEDKTLRGKAADTVKGKVAGNSNRCACNARISDESVTCTKNACIRSAATDWESMHPEAKKKFVQRGKLKRKSEGWVPKDLERWK